MICSPIYLFMELFTIALGRVSRLKIIMQTFGGRHTGNMLTPSFMTLHIQEQDGHLDNKRQRESQQDGKYPAGTNLHLGY
jgi:hypothetical protein